MSTNPKPLLRDLPPPPRLLPVMTPGAGLEAAPTLLPEETTGLVTVRRATRRRPGVGLWLAAAFLLLLAVAAAAPGLLTAADPLAGSGRDAFYGPGAAHWFGTDENGRDVLSRLVHGVRPSLFMGFAATGIALVAGVALGLLAGLGGRIVDGAVGRLLDTFLAFPDLLLALVIITFWGQGLANAIIAVGVAAMPRYARMVRAQAQIVRRAAYVEAALTLGQHPAALVWRHILPNSVQPVLLIAAIGVGSSIGAGAALSFLGFGAPPPAPEWGAMLAVGRNFLANAWWLVAAPGVAITLTVLSITALGRAAMRRGGGQFA